MLHALGTDGDLWEVGGEIAGLGGARLPLRMTVLRLPDGGLLLHSPVEIDDALATELAAQGPVRHLVAPNPWHHFFLRRAQRRYPEARTWAAAGLQARRPNLRIDAALTDGSPPEWGGALEVRLLGGAPRLGEAVFLHRPSGTLVCTDLVLNMRSWDGWRTGMMLALFGTRGRLAGSRTLHLLVSDRTAFRAALRAVGQWPFQRILMGHGAVHESATAPDDLLAALALRLGPGLQE